jgi:cobalt-zinc-cadmium efflux system outer membrane protein
VLLLFSGCFNQNSVEAAEKEEHFPNREPDKHTLSRGLANKTVKPIEVEKPISVITLSQSLSMALVNNPELASFSWEMRAGEARTLQAGLLPNPEVDIEVENVGGSGDRRGFDAAETTISLSQLIELGGKRAYRVKMAALENEVEKWDYESKRLDVFTETTKAFVEVLAAQKRFALAEDFVRLSKRVAETVSERVRAGKVPPLEETKSKVVFSTRQIERERARRHLKAARKGLAANWGSVSPKFTSVAGNFEFIKEIPTLEQMNQRIDQNPDLARWKTEIQSRQANIAVQKADRIPDLTLAAGVRRFEETDDTALVFGMSLPLPLFDRKQGSLQEAQHKLTKSREEQRAIKIRVESSLDQTHQVLSASYLEALSLKNDVLPAAQLAFDVAREGYQQGKFGYLDVLDAQRTLFEAKAQYIDSLAAYHKLMAEMERLVGLNFDSSKSSKSLKKEEVNEN